MLVMKLDPVKSERFWNLDNLVNEQSPKRLQEYSLHSPSKCICYTTYACKAVLTIKRDKLRHPDKITPEPKANVSQINSR